MSAALEQWNERRRRIFYPKTDLDFDLEALRRRREALARIELSKVASILDEEVRAIRFLPNAGTFHALFQIDASKRYILKLAPEAPAFGFAIEAWAMRQLAHAGLPALEIRAFSVLAGELPVPYLIVEQANGRPLREFENPDTQAMPEPLLFELGKTLARIHAVETRGAGLLDVGTLETNPSGLLATWKDYIHLRLEEHVRVCREIEAISAGEAATIGQLFANIPPPQPLRLLHGDTGHHNFFSDGLRITAVIDWEDALSGDPIFDVAYWGTFVRDEMRARFLEGYSSVQPLPADFERRYWLYYLRVALSKTVHRHHFRAKDRLGRPPASQRIQKALSNLAKL